MDPLPISMMDAGSMRRLLEGVSARDNVAFTQVVVALDQDLLRVAFVVAHDAEVARDAVQSTWQRFWSNPPKLRDPSTLRSWLLKVAINEVRQTRRHSERARSREQKAASDSPAWDPASGSDQLDLRAALEALEPSDRELLALRYVVEMTSDEIGKHLGLTPEGARSRLHRLILRLRKDLTHA